MPDVINPDSTAVRTRLTLDVRTLDGPTRDPRIDRELSGLPAGDALVLVTDRDPSPLRNRLQRERGLDFDWTPLEEGPAVWRIQIDRNPTAATARTVMQYLAWDHDRIDSLIQRVRALAAAASWPDARRTFTEMRHGLERHIRMEEDVLFPLFEARSGIGSGGPTAVMRAEHAQIRSALDRLSAALPADEGREVDPPAFLGELAAMVAILSDHNLKEEEVLYPMIDQMLAAPERSDLMMRLQRV